MHLTTNVPLIPEGISDSVNAFTSYSVTAVQNNMRRLCDKCKEKKNK